MSFTLEHPAIPDTIDELLLHGLPELLTEPRWCKVHALPFTQNGQARSWEIVESHDAVAVLVHVEDTHEVVLVRQFRPAVWWATARQEEAPLDTPHIHGYTIELPAGLMDKDGGAAYTAAAEVWEETGYRVDPASLVNLGVTRASVGAGGSQLHLFYARTHSSAREGAGGGVPGEGESIQVIHWPISDIPMLLAPTATIPRPPGLMYALLWLHQQLSEQAVSPVSSMSWLERAGYVVAGASVGAFLALKFLK